MNKTDIQNLLSRDSITDWQDKNPNRFSLEVRAVWMVIKTLQQKKFEAYVVGGCVRDILSGRAPYDWDVATSALPDDVLKMFEHTYKNNDFGTIGVIFKEEEEEVVVEVTTFRTERTYTDARRPDGVEYCLTIEEDLKRRDFTINSIALDPVEYRIVDPLNGMQDLKDGIIRAVLDVNERFKEDLLRMLRAVRIATTTGFELTEDVKKAIQENAGRITHISAERIRDEFTKIILSKQPMRGILLLNGTGLLQAIIPELKKGEGCVQNQAHMYDVFEHNLRTLQHSADKGYSLPIRLSALLHDIAKPHTREFSKEKNDWTFHTHEVYGAKLAKETMKKLRYTNDISKKVVTLVRWHMFFSDTDTVTLSSVRRLIARVGKDGIWDLIKLRICDRIGTGRPKEQPYRLRKFMSMVDEVMRDPIHVSMLNINGKVLMEEEGVSAGPRIGWVLHALLEEVLEDTTRNERGYLLKRAGELLKLSDEDLKKIGEAGKEKMIEEDTRSIEELRKQRGVR